MSAHPFPLASVRPTFRALTETVAPGSGGLGREQWKRAEEAVGRVLALRPDAVVRQVVSFLRILEWLPLPRFGRRFSRLSPARRLAVLRSLERAPLLTVRRGVWGVRTLAFLAYYGLDEVRDAIGYRASASGRDARPGST